MIRRPFLHCSIAAPLLAASALPALAQEWRAAPPPPEREAPAVSMPCAPAALLRAGLERDGFSLESWGLMSGALVAELWVRPDRDWIWLIVNTGGVACVPGLGDSWSAPMAMPGDPAFFSPASPTLQVGPTLRPAALPSRPAPLTAAAEPPETRAAVAGRGGSSVLPLVLRFAPRQRPLRPGSPFGVARPVLWREE